ncbi:hypothetical protein OV203_47125 [Nannocystis sp. ILAH1]|uniref:hypothetical protein n=1 Tax=Nannocystis sp. ILAH1 TaxID=2996789 RepID=UPI00226D98E2|nr:hypothetical protein [Nannocystis sp. ILAH1]MCY0994790.1 hypothetical protein [Nannocystis sp. ILAH1]
MIDTETREKMDYLGEQIAKNLARLGGVGVLPAGEGDLPACGTGVPKIGCENLLYAPITVARFYRGGRTNIDQVVEGQIPVAPGSSVVLSQAAYPPWATGCYVLRYRLANNANNHDDIRIEWFVDTEPLDAIQYGSEIYNNDNTVIGEGKLPIPLAMGEHCCIGGNNRLRVRISHLGNANQIENIRLHVEHANAVKCCSSCAAGRACQRGCKGGGDK